MQQLKFVCKTSELQLTTMWLICNVSETLMFLLSTSNNSESKEILRLYIMTQTWETMSSIQAKKLWDSMLKITATDIQQCSSMWWNVDWTNGLQLITTTKSQNKQCDSLDNSTMQLEHLSKYCFSIAILLDTRSISGLCGFFSCFPAKSRIYGNEKDFIL